MESLFFGILLTIMFALFFTPSTSWATSENCEPYDLRESSVGPDRPLPVQREQGASGWCYAMVLSDLLSYKFKATVSSTDIALHHLNSHFTEHWKRYQTASAHSPARAFPLGGGRLTMALNDLKSRGVCLEQNFASHLTNQDPPAMTKAERQPASVDTDITAKGLSRFFSNEHQTNLQSLVKDVKDPQLFSALQKIAAQPHCSPQFRHQFSQMNLQLDIEEKTSSMSALDFYKRLDDSVSQYKMLAITYSPEVLTSVAPVNTKKNGTHLSSIVGRRFNKEKTRCEYLVRNSEGSCQDYAQDYECQNNHVWIPRQTLQSATSHFMYFPTN
ncbi:hypothetical protein [Pseudobdellovibrio exovorus]|uniref:Peptidase C1A papain C-terminal domain-containing protein n=1 Tax=Pseudobdellovibrio exovorus JSS TaxID=1184267 RepID=M4VBD7_9BACT|nr:hypothetical protein [Pseudobdellovibrio exovorus]AGH95800.1 hypothetical protein A11Q_1584 [Pseudobdellovibrio exovorus JSS]